MTQFKRNNEDNVLPKNWRFGSIVDGLKSSYDGIKSDSTGEKRSLFLLIVSMPNIELKEHGLWFHENIPVEELENVASEGHSVVVVCVSSNAIFFRTVHSKGFSKSSSDEEMKYFEYGMEKELETVNLCINNCSKEEFVEEELSDGYEKMQYMFISFG